MDNERSEKNQQSENQHSANQQSGKLVICPTPIGNLGDVTTRMRECLSEAQVVYAEDTRVTGKLLAALGIHCLLERLDEATLTQRAPALVQRVLNGSVVAYCSDAGMPGVCDPGLRLVHAAREAGARVEVLPGPVAAVTAYVASGCTNQRFFFGGFFPRKDAMRRAELTRVAALDAALIYYESPKRVVRSLSVIAEEFPLREMAVCRELTKVHEEVVRGTTVQLCDIFMQREHTEGIKGEIVLVLDAPTPAEHQAADEACTAQARMRAQELRTQGATKKDITQALVSEFSLPRNAAYALALEK